MRISSSIVWFCIALLVIAAATWLAAASVLIRICFGPKSQSRFDAIFGVHQQESSASPLPSSTTSSLTSFGSAIQPAYIQDESQDLTTTEHQAVVDLLLRESERQIHSIKTQDGEGQLPYTGHRSEERPSSLAARPMPSLAAAITLSSTDSSICGSTEERNPLLLHRCSQDLVRGSSIAGRGGDNVHGRFRSVEGDISSQSNTRGDYVGVKRSAVKEHENECRCSGPGLSGESVRASSIALPHLPSAASNTEDPPELQNQQLREQQRLQWRQWQQQMPNYGSGLSSILSHIREPAPPLSVATTESVPAISPKSSASTPFQVDPESVPQAIPLTSTQALAPAHECGLAPETEPNGDSSKQWWFQRVFSRPQERAPDQLPRAAVSGNTVSGEWLTVDRPELDGSTGQRVNHASSNSSTEDEGLGHGSLLPSQVNCKEVQRF